MKPLTFEMKTKKTIKELKSIHGGLSSVSASTVNVLANRFVTRYKTNLSRTLIIRTKYTFGAIGLYKATAIRSTGEFRSIRKIDAKVFVKNYKGGPHYLAIQELGLSKHQQQSANNYVSMPTNQARKGGSFKGSVRAQLSLRKAPYRSLRIGGRAKSVSEFGSPSDGFTDPQRIAILHKYKKLDPYGWDLKTPFQFFLGGHSDFYQMKGNKFQMVRMLRKKTQKVKPIPNFENAFNSFTQNEVYSVFLRESKKI